MTLQQFLAAEAARPFVWGDTDCASTADRWVRHCTGRSPLALYGRAHRDAAEAKAWLAEAGGLVAAVPRVMRAAGLRLVDDLTAGDVGLIQAGSVACVAIWTGQLWFSRHEGGLLGLPGSCKRRAWRVA